MTPKEFVTDFNTQAFNEFEAAFGFVSASNSYPGPPSHPDSPPYSHSHDDTTGDESGDFFPGQSSSSSKRPAMETRKRKPGNRKTVQPQDQILKRRVQNRAAQRSFRERQKEYVHDLEHQVELLKGEIGKMQDNYQDLVKAVTSQPRLSQGEWSGDLSPATSLDELEYGGSSVDGSAFQQIKIEDNLWPSSVENQGLFY